MLQETKRAPCPVLDELGDIGGYFLKKDIGFDKTVKLGSILDKLRDKLGNIKRYFLKEDVRFDPNSEESQRLLGAIWYIAESYSPHTVNVNAPVHLSVPSLRLGELGLISEDTAHKMRKRISQALESNPFEYTNKLRLKRVGNRLMIEERYVDVAGYYEMNHDGARLDRIVRERMYLRNDNGVYYVQMDQAITHHELHALQQTWMPRLPTPDEFKPIEVTQRRLNTTLALIVEGTRREYIK